MLPGLRFVFELMSRAMKTDPDPLRYGGYTTDDPREAPGILLSYIARGSRVFDVGCGTGSLASAVRDKLGCQVVGLEPNVDRARVASERGIEVVNRMFTRENVAGLPKFDVVMFADVLEHFADPIEALQLARTLLAPGGCIVASVPNVAHWTVRVDLLRGRFEYGDLGIMDATHLRWFTSASLLRLFTSAGFEVEHLKGAAGLWMSEYGYRRPTKWLNLANREALILFCLRRWPGAFSSQFVVKSKPVFPG